jgi:hypothetical protein
LSREHLLWNSSVDRLFRSGHTGLAGHLFLGTRYFGELPSLVPARRDNPHVWVMGGTGTGKSARVLAPLIAQYIALGYSLEVFDPKPDKALFESCRFECYHQEMPFRYVCITPGRWSYAFPPLAQSHAAAQTLASRAETWIQSLNLDYGVQYGGSYFTAMEEMLCIALLTLFPDARSPEEVARLFDSTSVLRNHLGERGWQDSSHIRSILSKLASVTPLNLTPNSPGITREVLNAAIDMRQPFYTPQVIYFALDSAQLRTSTRATLGLGFYNLLAAAKHVGPEPNVPVVCVIDEAQETIGPNLSILLEQSRSMGIQLVLAHQNLSQLRKHDTDYQGTFEENTGLQVVFNPVSRSVREWMEATSGQQLYVDLKWSQDFLPGMDFRAGEAFHPKLARASGFLDFPELHLSERLGPVWDRTDLMRLSAEPGVAWVRVTRDQGYSRDSGQWVPIRSLFHIDPDAYRARRLSPWPGPNGQTVLVEQSPAFDRRFTDPPPVTPKTTRIRNTLRRFREQP